MLLYRPSVLVTVKLDNKYYRLKETIHSSWWGTKHGPNETLGGAWGWSDLALFCCTLFVQRI